MADGCLLLARKLAKRGCQNKNGSHVSDSYGNVVVEKEEGRHGEGDLLY